MFQKGNAIRQVENTRRINEFLEVSVSEEKARKRTPSRGSSELARRQPTPEPPDRLSKEVKTDSKGTLIKSRTPGSLAHKNSKRY